MRRSRCVTSYEIYMEASYSSERVVGITTCRGHIFKASVDRGAIILTMTSSLTRRGVGAGARARGAICALNHATNKIYGAEIKTRSFSLLRSFPAPPRPRGKSIGIFPSVRATRVWGRNDFVLCLLPVAMFCLLSCTDKG